MIEIECKYCGSTNGGFIVKAKSPHAYRVDCVDCGCFAKWASKYDVEGVSENNKDELLKKIKECEDLAIIAARASNGLEVFKQLTIRDKYAERLSA